MAANKKTASGGWTTLARRVSLSAGWLVLRGEGRLTLVGIGLLAALTAGPYIVWKQFGPRLAASADYRLTPERVELSPHPDSVGWIRRDVRLEALRDAGLDGGVSILDDDLCERLAKAFELHPWIARVRQVAKRYPARAEVLVEYRRPAAIVVAGPELWWPVDTAGVVLPREDFTGGDLRRYPHITGISAGPYGPTGTRWGDSRVENAAKIAAALAADWQKLALARIAPLAISSSEEGDEDYAYALFTKRGRRVYWGYGPDRSPRGEPTTEEKVARLREYLARFGPLDGDPASGTGEDLDLRNPRGVVAVPLSARRGGAD